MGWLAALQWSEKETDTLKRMWSEGASAGSIARALEGRSRNSVIGRVHRLRLASRKTLVRKEVGGRKPRNSPTNGHISKLLNVINGTEVIDLPPDTSDNPIHLRELKPHHCRWPLNENMMFCGDARLEDYPYCKRHCRIAFRVKGEVA